MLINANSSFNLAKTLNEAGIKTLDDLITKFSDESFKQTDIALKIKDMFCLWMDIYSYQETPYDVGKQTN